MKIIIAGAGAVGTHLAQLLARESQDIVLIDEDPEKTERLASSGDADLLTMNIPPTSIRAQKEAGVQHADLFIAVTPDESRNITCCMLAHTLGAKKTVARVDNSEYMLPQSLEFMDKMGVNSLIYPEMLASREIIEGVKRSWVRQYWEVHGGSLIVLGIKLRQEARILGKPLWELCPPNSPYRIAVIKRADDTIIPRGADQLLAGDIIYVMTTKKHIQLVRHLVGKEDYADVRNVMVMGGDKMSVHVAHDKPDNMNMKIIEPSRERCDKLNELLENDDIMVVNGDARDARLLIDEGIRDVQAFVALTQETETNILACLAAKRLGVRKTVALVENLDYVSMAERLDIGTIINKKMIAASHIYKMMLDTDVANVKCLTIARADVAEFIAAEGSLVTQAPVRKLDLPLGVNLGGLVRGGVGQAIDGNTQILPGDCVVVFCLSSLIKKLDRYFCRPATILQRVISTVTPS